MPAASLEYWIDALQTRGRYSFLRAEALGSSGLSAQAASPAIPGAAPRSDHRYEAGIWQVTGWNRYSLIL
jgi:hypothetical protein